MKTPLTFIGVQDFGNGRVFRLFNLRLENGVTPTFTVKKGECLKTKMQEIQKRFAGGQAA